MPKSPGFQENTHSHFRFKLHSHEERSHQTGRWQENKPLAQQGLHTQDPDTSS